MKSNQPLSPDPHSSSEQVFQPMEQGSFVAAVMFGVWAGAKYGAAIAGSLALLLASASLVVAYGFTQQKESIGVALLSMSLGVTIYTIGGAIIGAVIMGVVAAARRTGRSRLQTTIRVILALVMLVVVSLAVGFTIYWLTLPGLTTENHVFFFLNLCQKDKYEDAGRYLERHREIITDNRALNHQPTLLAVAFFDGDPRTTQLLLDHGADVHATDEVGTTALDVAIISGHLRIALLLLERGAKPGRRCRIQDAMELKAYIERQLSKDAPGQDQKKEHR